MSDAWALLVGPPKGSAGMGSPKSDALPSWEMLKKGCRKVTKVCSAASVLGEENWVVWGGREEFGVYAPPLRDNERVFLQTSDAHVIVFN